MKTIKSLPFAALIAAALASPLAMSAEKPVMEQQISCQLMKVIAENVISSRQNGVVEQVVQNRISEVGNEFSGARNLAKTYINRAYQIPVMLDSEAKQQLIESFGDRAYDECVCQWQPNKGI
ncbi:MULTISPECIES: hypothetical protein [Thiomicrorhabdus]|uniref:Uncharacterized protein n=1 Tax=Thiomicrorhabdus heinhorstiae TaxID=2748010 RepID=A0ABS0BVL0_9GAMM|nr:MULTISPECIES: hypothetical protein [Thiomicrorhabdus]MBF6057110.1 hypothetical protein [Thiomicrorhabdus heinhorstiae]